MHIKLKEWNIKVQIKCNPSNLNQHKYFQVKKDNNPMAKAINLMAKLANKLNYYPRLPSCTRAAILQSVTTNTSSPVGQCLVLLRGDAWESPVAIGKDLVRRERVNSSGVTFLRKWVGWAPKHKCKNCIKQKRIHPLLQQERRKMDYRLSLCIWNMRRLKDWLSIRFLFVWRIR